MSNGKRRKISIQVLASPDYTYRNEEKIIKAEIQDLEKVTKTRDAAKIKISKAVCFKS